MSSVDLPLLDLFNRLREHCPLGIDEYMLALRALQAGFGLGDRRAIVQLCCLLWTKSDEDVQLLHRLFEQMLVQLAPPTKELSIPDPLQHPSEPSIDREPEMSPSELSQPISPTPPNLTLEMDEPVEVVQAIRRSARADLDMRRPRFNLLTEYFPVTRRQMKQSWRSLRRPVREGPPEELDVVATVEKIGRQGLLLAPVLVPRRRNRADLVLMIDQGGSMVPFHNLSRQLVETAQRGGRLGRAGVYYFHNYPLSHLYCDPALLEALPIPDALAAFSKRTAVLIVSDAGAARGNFEMERVKETQEFIGKLKQSVRYYAWLNPLPNNRWHGTTAGEIARMVPMFEMNRHGLDVAISMLRGRYTYWQNMYSWMI